MHGMAVQCPLAAGKCDRNSHESESKSDELLVPQFGGFHFTDDSYRVYQAQHGHPPEANLPQQ
jgi:hypothetical protein